ncbi:MAG TPA: PqqD family protein [Actinotalea sp.]|nr:PqqD family protein [Actinotalea sp.]
MTGGFHRPEKLAVVAGDVAGGAEARLYLATMPAGPVLVLGRPAADIWRAAVEVHDPEAVVDTVAATFAVPADDIRDDVLGFLEQLRDQGVLEWREGPAPR